MKVFFLSKNSSFYLFVVFLFVCFIVFRLKYKVMGFIMPFSHIFVLIYPSALYLSPDTYLAFWFPDSFPSAVMLNMFYNLSCLRSPLPTLCFLFYHHSLHIHTYACIHVNLGSTYERECDICHSISGLLHLMKISISIHFSSKSIISVLVIAEWNFMVYIYQFFLSVHLWMII